MNLDLDDPLGDLLSDGSNDSLFGFEPTKKSSLPAKLPEKKDEKSSEMKMEQLFGIEDRKTEAIKPKTAELKLFSNELNSPVKTLPLRPATAAAGEQQKFYQPKTSTDDFKNLDIKSNDSLSSDVGGVVAHDPKKSKRKMSILDELLGIGETTTSSKSQYQSSTKSVARENPPQAKATTISRQTTFETVSDYINSDITTSATGAAAAAVSATKKTGRRQSAVAFSDPLGLFGPNEKEKDQIKKAQTKQSRKSIAGSEWLFNAAETQNAPESRPVVSKTKSSPAIQITPNPDERHDEEVTQSNVTSLESKNTVASSNIAITGATRHPLETLVNQNVDAQTTSLNSLKQQEFQLMVATQMKTQENVLVEMKNKQQELLRQQEGQFNELLRKQISRQSELEEIIRNQQVEFT